MVDEFQVCEVTTEATLGAISRAIGELIAELPADSQVSFAVDIGRFKISARWLVQLCGVDDCEAFSTNLGPSDPRSPDLSLRWARCDAHADFGDSIDDD